jgi:hypothetical protein
MNGTCRYSGIGPKLIAYAGQAGQLSRLRLLPARHTPSVREIRFPENDNFRFCRCKVTPVSSAVSAVVPQPCVDERPSLCYDATHGKGKQSLFGIIESCQGWTSRPG